MKLLSENRFSGKAYFYTIASRAFPCSHPGLTYASWICVDKFSDPRSDPHPVRLLTVGRQVKVGNDGGEADNNFVCLSLCLSAR